MLKLHGIALSNYTSMVRAALEEKGIAYEFVLSPPSQEADYTARSPMGKVPCVEVAQGHLSETSAILDYLEEIHPEPALMPIDPFARAKVRELCQAMALYVELVARKGVGVLFGKETPDHIKKGMARDLPRGVKAVGQLTAFSPWIAGEQLTYADFFGYYTFTLANTLASMNCDLNLFEQLPGAVQWYAKVGALDSVKFTDSEMAAARAAMER